VEGSGHGIILRQCLGICLEGLNKITKILSHNRRSRGRDFNPEPAEYEVVVSTSRPLCSVFMRITILNENFNKITGRKILIDGCSSLGNFQFVCVISNVNTSYSCKRCELKWNHYVHTEHSERISSYRNLEVSLKMMSIFTQSYIQIADLSGRSV
jgi:hypothetical protein